MFWAGIILDGRTSLHLFERCTVTGVRNLDKIFEPYVPIDRGAFDPDIILRHDSEYPRSAANKVCDFPRREDIRRRSPDLNPMKHVWVTLGNVFVKHNCPPQMYKACKLRC